MARPLSSKERSVPVLASQQRKILEDACTNGRRASEQAVRAALTSLAVTAERPPAHLNEEDRQLRRGLRAKARQLGDKGESLELLVAECAYEQWHRLLFARFLAENNLLIHPEYHAPVTLEDCDELAGSLGEPDGWSVAARFAAEILPGIFRLDDPCVRLRLVPEGRLALETILAGLPAEVFAADDALGWVYQFWQKDKKDEVNGSERKIGGADLGPVTQLFTEHYMVRFLLENSLGAWWAARHPDSPLVKTFDNLRVNDDEQPVVGRFDGWPERVADVTVMDPCCGSGHFLVEAFGMLWQMRAEEEGLSVVVAQDAVLRENLFGLELDPRCVQIAMFGVALQAWKQGGGWRQLPVPNIACSGIPVRASVDEWKALANGDPRLENALVRLHILFRDADMLASLIDPKQATELADQTGLQQSFDDADWDDIAPLLQQAGQSEAGDPATSVLGADAAGIARATDYLSRHYTLITTNPPFLDHKKQSEVLVSYLQATYPQSFRELAVAMLERCFALAAKQVGVVAFVIPALWTSARPFEDFRKALLTLRGLELLVALGTGAFDSIGGEVVNVLLLVSSAGRQHGIEPLLGDVSTDRGPAAKAAQLRATGLTMVSRTQQLSNPRSRVMFTSNTGLAFVGDLAVASAGIQTGDNNRFQRHFWELPAIEGGWIRIQRSPKATALRAGMSMVLRWDGGSGEFHDYVVERLGGSTGAWIRGLDLWGKDGIVVSRIANVPATLYSGEAFADNAVVIVPRRPDDLPMLWSFVSSPEFTHAVRQVDPRLSVTVGTFLGTPLDVTRWRLVATDRFPDGLPEPWSDDPTQWLFEGRPEVSAEPLQVAVARLLGFRWPEQPDVDDLDRFADADGIVCVPSVAGEAPAADRVQQLLVAAYGDEWSPAKQKELLEATGSKKKNLGDWLRDDFFKQHCVLFAHRPFVWHIWDGQRDGFAALANYHRLDRKILEKLTYTYLGDWIERQRAEVRDDKAGAEARLAAASTLRRSLQLILDGEPPYDIHVRWKLLSEQPIGWDPDVNDGVRANVRPLFEAGVLRSSFNIHWRKDGGTSPDGSERRNDLHFTAAEKRAARGGSK